MKKNVAIFGGIIDLPVDVDLWRIKSMMENSQNICAETSLGKFGKKMALRYNKWQSALSAGLNLIHEEHCEHTD